jgi:tRNA (pseudouridine54-N1)-methyltransferase
MPDRVLGGGVPRFVIIGRTATAGADFLLDDLPGTSGRLDVLLRCIRAALLTSHGVRRDTVIDLVLLGGPEAPRVARIDGASAKFLRPDERPLATLLKKSLAAHAMHSDPGGEGCFVEVRPGIAIARGGLEVALADRGRAPIYVLDESGVDVRTVKLDPAGIFLIGDHQGLDEAARAMGEPISIGPVSLHSDDVVAIVANELDRAFTIR